MIFPIRRIIGFIRNRVATSRRILAKKTVTKLPMSKQKQYDIPVVVVLGETGVGKTKLAVELCRRFKGEVISADSMQIYEGLDIITNKVTPDEACGIPHHLISILSPLSSNYNVQVFQSTALKIVEEMWQNRRSIPVIVGGTNYYIESLLWNRLVCPQENKELDETDPQFTSSIPFDVTEMTNGQLHEELERVDPVTAERTHPSNRRRVIRSLQIFYQTGRQHSEWLSDQHSATGANILGGPLRFKRICVLWIKSDKEVLKDRLRHRVDEMVMRGLREEISSFYDRYSQECKLKYGADITTKGILQAIGLKEFEKYLELSQDERFGDEAAVAFNEGVERLKLVTVRYARKQRQWIMNRFRVLAARDDIPIYYVDSTDVTKWTENVSTPSQHVVDAFLAGRTPEGIPEMESVSLEDYVKERTVENRYCEACERVIPGLQWNDHLRSKGHRALSSKRRS